MTDQPNDLPMCDDDIFANGVGLCVLDARSHAAETWVKSVAEKSGQRVDWHYSGGWANVLVLGDHAVALATARELSSTLDGRVMSFSEDGRALYRAGEPGGRPAFYSRTGPTVLADDEVAAALAVS